MTISNRQAGNGSESVTWLYLTHKPNLMWGKFFFIFIVCIFPSVAVVHPLHTHTQKCSSDCKDSVGIVYLPVFNYHNIQNLLSKLASMAHYGVGMAIK